jgi:branched-chain amino acid transport system substrate-binding protein
MKDYEEEMMRTDKRLILVSLLVLAMVVGACGGEPAPAATTAPTQAAAEPTAAPAASSEPILIGLVTPLTGANALDGTEVRHGAELAVKEINEAGGVAGRPLQLVVEDGKADPTESTNAAEKLITRDKVVTLIGCWASSATIAAMPIVEQNQVPLVVEISTNPTITEQGNKWVFRTSSNETLNSQFLGTTAVNDLGFKKIAYLAVNNDWGRGAATNYTKIVTEAGAEVVLTEYSEASEVNFYPILNKVKASGADSIFVTHGLQSMANLFKQMRELEINLPVLSTGGYTLESMAEASGGDASIYEGAYTLAYTIPADIGRVPKVTKFVDDYAAAYPEDPIARGSGNGYDAVYVIAEAIKAAGSADPSAIRDALVNVAIEGVGGHLEFDETQQAHPTLYITQFQNGQQVIVDL